MSTVHTLQERATAARTNESSDAGRELSALEHAIDPKSFETEPQHRLRLDGRHTERSDNVELGELPSLRTAQTGRSAVQERIEDIQQTAGQKRTQMIHFCLLCLGEFMGGWNDAATGPLLPRIQRVYGVDFAIVSLLFLSNAIGFFLGGLTNMKIADKIGFGRTSLLGASIQVVGYAILASAPPFPLFAIGFAIVGWGLAVVNTQGNMYVTTMQGGGSLMGFLHATYGIGALIVPLSSTRFSQMHHWSFHYLTAIGLALIDCGLLYLVFGFQRHEDLLRQIGKSPLDSASADNSNKFRKMMKLKATHLLAIWAFVYVGWISTFLIDLRGAGPSAGYVSTGFWGGLTLGRVAFVWVNKKVGEMRVILAYTVIAIGLQITVWRIPSLFQNAIAVSFVGLFLGPMFPIAVGSAGKILPPSIFSIALGWIFGLGQSGSAFFPFITGILATKFGISVLQPVIVALMCVMLGVWAFIPHEQTHLD
ncbi:MFS general substrate transporter [Sistotremastrum niveocremeum HHB9708]|uniref:MFS general substrate transporter n=1 Tax=Sistotremastrum niveocremeum HHB9708 TaxID=1314777 RepID=A0A164S7F4_9AGAM|nr:MFS general substrate transporter [Sistotremastrum niveocremeum HHB9708]